MTCTVHQDIAGLARDVFDYPRLRPGQAEAVEGLLEGRDVLVVMPTGGGKSAIYQLAALEIPGPTVVVSPLVALQRDQMAAIARRRLAAAGQASSRKHREPSMASSSVAHNAGVAIRFFSSQKTSGSLPGSTRRTTSRRPCLTRPASSRSG